MLQVVFYLTPIMWMPKLLLRPAAKPVPAGRQSHVSHARDRPRTPAGRTAVRQQLVGVAGAGRHLAGASPCSSTAATSAVSLTGSKEKHHGPY
ncbi:hypothetical protein LP420_27155 [Massilia sp. B-10]|nr:hypothetical protein LP420_27155 [Massilia sp. B-10]